MLSVRECKCVYVPKVSQDSAANCYRSPPMGKGVGEHTAHYRNRVQMVVVRDSLRKTTLFPDNSNVLPANLIFCSMTYHY